MQVLEGKLNAEGRVVVPAPIRRALGLHAGDRVQFVLDDAGLVRLVTARQLRDRLWANNPSDAPAAVDVDHAVRTVRQQDDVQAERGHAAGLDGDVAFDVADEVFALLER